jgi:hypothetical protein
MGHEDAAKGTRKVQNVRGASRMRAVSASIRLHGSLSEPDQMMKLSGIEYRITGQVD